MSCIGLVLNASESVNSIQLEGRPRACRMNIAQFPVHNKGIYSFNVISTIISVAFSAEIHSWVLRLVWDARQSCEPKQLWERRTKRQDSWGLVSRLQQLGDAGVKEKHTGQETWMHSLETDPRNTVRGALNKGIKITRKVNIPAKGTARNPQLHTNSCV